MSTTLGLFEGYGIEMEYMIVDRQTLAVKPICDEVIQLLAGEIVNEVSLGRVNVSNELVAHVIEFKGNGPQSDLRRLQASFQSEIEKMNVLLQRWNACLLPTAMHPLMDPLTDTKLWPHGQNSIYKTYDRIFNCKGHGWANLQSVHINLPFADDAEFARLHAAIRIALPLLPALAASSPVVEGKLTGKLDNRLSYYAQNQKKIPAIIGDIIPEAVFSRREYEEKILDRIYRDVSTLDPEGELEGEWLNSRGAIARFERNAIEIRILDIQESLPADFAVISLVISLVKSLVEERWIPFKRQCEADERQLKLTFMGAVSQGGNFVLTDKFLLECFGQTAPLTIQNLWQKLTTLLVADGYPVKEFSDAADLILQKGSLSERLIKKLGPEPDREKIVSVWTQLADCLQAGRIYG